MPESPRLTFAARALLVAMLNGAAVGAELHRRRDGTARVTYFRTDTYAACTALIRELDAKRLVTTAILEVPTLTAKGRLLAGQFRDDAATQGSHG